VLEAVAPEAAKIQLHSKALFVCSFAFELLEKLADG
jgi:hypothetical protein